MKRGLGRPTAVACGPGAASESGQAAILLLGVTAALLAGALVLAAFGQALGARGKHQRAADLAAVSAAQAMRDAYPRLFEPAWKRPGVPNPRHLTEAEYVAIARRAAVTGASRNGVALSAADVRLASGSFAPVRVTVRVRGEAPIRVHGGDRPGAVREVAVRAQATAELSPVASGAAYPMEASGGGYSGRLAYRQGKPMRPDVALAFDRMAAAARGDGILLSITSGYRSDAEQARLYAARPDPRWVAPPGQSLHRLGTELDLGPPSAYDGWPGTPSDSASSSATPGSPGISVTRATRARRRSDSAEGARTAAARCPRSCLSATARC